MIRLLIRVAIFVGSAAIGLLAAMWLLPDVQLSWSGSVVAVVVFAVIQSVINPFLLKLAAKNAPAFLGGIGLLSTFVALFAASLFPGGLQIGGGFRTWILATLVVWLVTAIATMFLPMLLLKKTVGAKRGSGLPIG